MRAYRSWSIKGILLFLAAALLASCAGFGANPTPEPVTIKFAYLQKAANYEQLGQEFTRLHPNITVEFSVIKVDQFNQPTQNIKDLVDKVDAMRIAVTNVSPEVAAQFLPLDMQITTASDFPHKDLLPGALDALKLDGKQVALPAGIDPMVVYYLPLKFKAAGVEAPPPTWTLEDFVATATKLNNSEETLRGTSRFLYGFCSHPALPETALFTYLFGGGLLENLTTVSKPTLNQQANVDALTWYAGLRNEFKLMPPANTPREVGTLIARENCGMWIDWLDRSVYGSYTADEPLPLPLPAYKAQFNVANLNAYVVMSKSEHPEEAWEWINFLMQQQAASGSLIPPLRSEIASQEYGSRASKATLAVARNLPEQTVMLGLEMYRNERFGQVLQLYGLAASRVYTGEVKDAKAALDDAQLQADQAFK